MTASSLFTGGRFAIDPELRGAEFERITQNLDVHFWKAFWNITEIEVLSSLANMASATLRVRPVYCPSRHQQGPVQAEPGSLHPSLCPGRHPLPPRKQPRPLPQCHLPASLASPGYPFSTQHPGLRYRLAHSMPLLPCSASFNSSERPDRKLDVSIHHAQAPPRASSLFPAPTHRPADSTTLTLLLVAERP